MEMVDFFKRFEQANNGFSFKQWLQIKVIYMNKNSKKNCLFNILFTKNIKRYNIILWKRCVHPSTPLAEMTNIKHFLTVYKTQNSMK